MIIYKITNRINGKIYIGQTVLPLKKRIWNHMCKTGTAISAALRKYGIENFIIEEIDHAETKEELDAKEQYWIAYYSCIAPKGDIVIDTGKLFQRNGYRIKILNTINFKKSMHYNPFAYLHSEKDILKLVTTLIANTKGEGKGGDDFWQKAETLLYTALIGYIYYEAPKEEQNFSTLIEFINAMEVREDDEEFKNPVDLMFDELAERDPNHFAVRQYAKYRLAAGNTDYEICIYIRTYTFDVEKNLGTADMIYSCEDPVNDYWTDKRTFLYGALEGSDEYGHIVSLKAGESTTIPAKAFISPYGNLLDGYGPIYEMEIASFYNGKITEEGGYEDVRYTTYYFRVNNSETKKIKDNLKTPTTPVPTTPDTLNASNFTDVKSTDYFADAVRWAVEKNITSGTSATTFSPGTTCNRAQILTFLWRANGSPEPTAANPFTDIKPADYYYKAALWAAEKGLVSGSAFGGGTDCTRAMTVEYLWKAAGSPTAAKQASFNDVPASADYTQAVAWAVEQGITSGTDGGNFSPAATCTRGQIVTFLHRAMG